MNKKTTWKKGRAAWAFLFLCFLGLSFFLPLSELRALGIDEKLPLRILKASETKKTVLINRGIEDGLVVGDHARFYLTTGVVARGVLIKASPSRSVWSLYEQVSDPDIVADRVMNLKITQPVKLTKDITKMFAEDEGPAPPPEGIVLAEGADDLDKNLSAEEQKDLTKLTGGASPAPMETFISNKTLEFWGMMHMNSLSTTNSTGTTGQGTSGSAKGVDFLLGMEKYFLEYDSWYGKLSLLPFIHYGKQEYTSIEGHTVSSGLFAFGFGTHYHFMAPPLSVNRPILFFGPTFGFGSATDQASLSSTTTTTLPTLTGKVTFFSLGGGVKYYMSMGVGFRAILDYYQRAETYAIEGSDDNYTKVIKGLRILMGLSYRF